MTAGRPWRLATAAVSVVGVAGAAALAVSVDGSVAEPVDAIELDRATELDRALAPLRPIPSGPGSSGAPAPADGLITPEAELASPPSTPSAVSNDSPAEATTPTTPDPAPAPAPFPAGSDGSPASAGSLDS